MNDLINYHKTINKEICLLKDKLKYLTKHPAENGRFREIILSNTIKKHLLKSMVLEQVLSSNNVKPEVIMMSVLKSILWFMITAIQCCSEKEISPL